MNVLLLLLIAVALFAGELLYFRIADRYNIIDKPNERSSHSYVTIRGGGIVVPLASVLYAIFMHEVHWAIIAGILLISVISFCDDVYNLPNRVRLLIHFLSVSLLLYGAQAFQQWNLLLIIVAYIVVVGTINAYNFMDGINGITGLYSLAAFVSLWWVNQRTPFTDDYWILFPALACIVFLFFNYRKKARCFAGDVGSVSLGLWVVGLILMAVMQTQDFSYLLLLSVYGVDTVFTIIHRLLLRQNIFEAHRLHLYQIMVNDRKMPHRLIAAIYAVVQLSTNIWVITTGYGFWIKVLCVCIPLGLLYVILKPRLMTTKTSLS